MKDQILMISGGTTFENIDKALNYYKDYDVEPKNWKSWRDWLAWSLEDLYDVSKVDFPFRGNEHYLLRKLIFEKYLSKLNDMPITITAHSLGTIFIMKYLLENKFPKKIKTLHLVSPIVDDIFQPKDDVEQCASFKFDFDKVGELSSMCEEIHIWHSTDDTMCTFKNTEFLMGKLPNAILHKFENRGHFLAGTFFELFDVLRK